MRSNAVARPLLAAALIAVALLAQLLMLVAPGGDAPVTMTAAEGSAEARPATVSMARKFPTQGRAMVRAAAVAGQHWNAAPCRGDIDVAWKAMPRRLNAVATWKDPGAAGDPQHFFDCRIEFNSRIAYDFARLCTAMGHEFGHLLGQRHTRRDGQFMSATYRRPAAQCR